MPIAIRRLQLASSCGGPPECSGSRSAPIQHVLPGASRRRRAPSLRALPEGVCLLRWAHVQEEMRAQVTPSSSLNTSLPKP